MITTNTAWDLKHAAMAKRPIYVLAIAGQATVYTTADLAAAGITGTLPDHRPWLKTPQGATQTITVSTGSSSIGELQCEVIDQAGELRALVGGTTLEGAAVTLSIGYPGIAYSEFVTLHAYQLYKIKPRADYTAWLFQARDQQMTAKRTVSVNPENGLPLSAENPWVLQGTPAEITQAMYLFALGRPVTVIDRAGMVALDAAAEGNFAAARPFRFHLTEPFEAKQFLETEIFKASGCYPVITNVGQISLRSSRPPAAGISTVFTFTEDNMTVLPDVDRQTIVNEIVWKIDFDDSGFANVLVYAEATSLSTYGRSGRMLIESKGLRTEWGAQWWCQDVSTRIFRRLAGVVGGLRGGAPILKIEAFLLSLPVWVGDYVTVTHGLMPDVTTGDLGVTDRVFEVVDRTPDYARGRMAYRLLDTGLTGLAAAHLWGSSARDFLVGTSEVY